MNYTRKNILYRLNQMDRIFKITLHIQTDKEHCPITVSMYRYSHLIKKLIYSLNFKFFQIYSFYYNNKNGFLPVIAIIEMTIIYIKISFFIQVANIIYKGLYNLLPFI